MANLWKNVDKFVDENQQNHFNLLLDIRKNCINRHFLGLAQEMLHN
jgi:hypothetical protein